MMSDQKENSNPAISEAVVTVGNFDGVHLGHQQILSTARRLAAASSAIVAAVTFDPHPLTLLAPERAPQCLMDTATKISALRSSGADLVIVIPATKKLLASSPREFIAEISSQVHPLGFVEGNNFYFGHNRSGNVETLGELGRELGFEVIVVDPVTIDLPGQQPQRVCSSLVRKLLAAGSVADATRCLGRAFSLSGRVVRGRGEGRRLGYPTANLDIGSLLTPGDGIYAGRARWDDSSYPASIFIGSCSTFGETARVVEAYLPDCDGQPRSIGDIYGREITLDFIEKIRDSKTFPGLDALKEAIAADVAATLKIAAAARQ